MHVHKYTKKAGEHALRAEKQAFEHHQHVNSVHYQLSLQYANINDVQYAIFSIVLARALLCLHTASGSSVAS